MQAATTKSTKSTESKRVVRLKKDAVDQLKKELEARDFQLNTDEIKIKFILSKSPLKCDSLDEVVSALSSDIEAVLAGKPTLEHPVLPVDNGKRTLTVQLVVKTSSPSTKPGTKLRKTYKEALKEQHPTLLKEFAKVRRELAEAARVEAAKQIEALKKEAAKKVRTDLNLSEEQNKLLDEELAKDAAKREKRRLAAAHAKLKADESKLKEDESDSDDTGTDGEETDGEETDGESD